MKIYFFLLALIISASTIKSQDPLPKVELHDGAFYDVFLNSVDQEVQVTNFGKWEDILDLAVSPDHRYFFFRHKEENGKSFKLTLYQIEPLKKIGEITPGYGGNFEWNYLNQIIHSWGCGTNCSNLVIYDLDLKRTFFTLSTGGFVYSPNKDILVQLTAEGNRFFIFDLRTIEFDGVKGYSDSISLGFDLQTLRFVSDYKFEIEASHDPSQKPMTIDFTDLSLHRVDPLETEQFYLRKN